MTGYKDCCSLNILCKRCNWPKHHNFQEQITRESMKAQMQRGTPREESFDNHCIPSVASCFKMGYFPYHLSEFAGGGTLHNNVIIKLVAHQQGWTNPTDKSLQMLDANIEILGATPMLFFIQHHIFNFISVSDWATKFSGEEQPSSLEKSNSNRSHFATKVTSCLKCFFLLQCLHHLCPASFSRMG